MRFNVLTDRWVPLEDGESVRHASFVELLTGAADARELAHPRDDFRFFGRMLLSALAQALFPSKDAAELRRRLEIPLEEREVSTVVGNVSADFHLVGPGAFLQAQVKEGAAVETSRLFLDVPSGSNHLLFRPPAAYEAICPSCAILGLYGCQAFAPSGGRGKSPGVRGAPPMTTLVWAPSIRQSVWANTLTQGSAASLGYPPDPVRPWAPRVGKKSGDAIGLVEGLFWQPRGLELRPRDQAGSCHACGVDSARLEIRGFEAKSKVEGGFYRHPFSPAIQDVAAGKRPWRPRMLRSDRPAWIGLADMLSIARGRSGNESIAHAAPVVAQWIERLGHRDVTLLVLNYSTNKAKVVGRFVETYTISMEEDLRSLVEHIGYFVECAESSLDALRGALRRSKGGFARADAESEFWRTSERVFFGSIDLLQRGRDPIEGFLAALRRRVLELYDQHTEMSCLDDRKQSLIAQQRRRLAGELRKIGGADAA